MLRFIPFMPLFAVLGAFATPATAAPLETPLKNQTMMLAYEVTVTGKRGGQTVRDRLVVRTPMFARESGALNPLGEGFTQSQEAYVANLSAATVGGGDDGTAAMLELNQLMEALVAICAPNEATPACAAAKRRVDAAQQRMTERGARIATAQAQVRRPDEDDHRFLIFIAGDGPSADPATVEASYEHGTRKGVQHLSGGGGLDHFFATGDMVVLDRRSGSLYLAVTWGLAMSGVRYVDIQPLAGAPGVRRLGLPFSSTVTLTGPQPTAGPNGDYAGSKTIDTNGLRYELRWRLLNASS